MKAIIHVSPSVKPGDPPPPSGYMAWHEWAEVQHKAGLRQKKCGRCGLWRFPQELSDEKQVSHPRDTAGNVHEVVSPICKACVAKG